MNNKIIEEIKKISENKKFVLVAIDGRCASGKTTLAYELQKELSSNLIHMDDFFLRPFQRTEKRLATPGGNIDHERFLEEVLIPLSKNEAFSYRPYICSKSDFGEAIELTPKKTTIIEGSYSCHPKLWDFYDLHIFLDCDPKTQIERIVKRNGKESAEIFSNKWIPLEEKYFEACRIKERCEM